MTELYRRGGRVGLRAWAPDSGSELMLTVSDRDRCWVGRDEHMVSWTDGANALNEHLVPYKEACRFLSGIWGCEGPSGQAVAPAFFLGPAGDPGEVYFLLSLEPGGVPSWLNEVRFDGATCHEDEGAGVIRVYRGSSVLTIRRSDGVPTSWAEEVEGRRVEASEVSPSWSAEEWDAAIAARLEQCTAGEEGMAPYPKTDFGPRLMLDWYVRVAGYGPKEHHRAWILGTLMAGVDVETTSPLDEIVAEFRAETAAGAAADAESNLPERLKELASTVGARLEAYLLTSACCREWSEQDRVLFVRELINSYFFVVSTKAGAQLQRESASEGRR